MNSYFFKITDDERKNILTKHKELYNGYLSLQKNYAPTQISVFDDVSDKTGFTLKGSDLVKEGKEQMCSECGGAMYEGECSECGSMNENWDTEDLNLDNSMDYMESDDYIYEFEIEEEKEYSPMMESFINIASKMNLIHETKKPNKQKIVESKAPSNKLDNELDSIKNFMKKINRY
jgi:RecJ-like exonuclease